MNIDSINNGVVIDHITAGSGTVSAKTLVDLVTDPGNGGTVYLYAKWSINSYTLTINPNGGSFNSTTSNTTVTQNYNTTDNNKWN